MFRSSNTVFVSGLPACISSGAHWAQRVCFQAVLVGKNEPWCGKDRHDSATTLPADRRAPRICWGGTVSRFRGESMDILSGAIVARRVTEIEVSKRKWYPQEINKKCFIRAGTESITSSQSTVTLQTDLFPVFIFFSAGSESVLCSLPAPENPQLEAACAREEGGFRGQSENRDWAMEPDDQRDVGRAQHGRPAQSKFVTEECVCGKVWVCAWKVERKENPRKQMCWWVIICLYYSYPPCLYQTLLSLSCCLCACLSYQASLDFLGVVEIPSGLYKIKYTYLNKSEVSCVEPGVTVTSLFFTSLPLFLCALYLYFIGQRYERYALN